MAPRSAEIAGLAIRPRKLIETEQMGARDPMKQRMFDRQQGKCWICGDVMLLVSANENPLAATFDHIKPVSLGGTWDEANLKLAHQICNSRRGNGKQRHHGPVYVRRQGSGALPFSAAWLKDNGYMEAPERLQDNGPGN